MPHPDPAHSAPARDDFESYADAVLGDIQDDDLFREEWTRLAHDTPAWVVWAHQELETERLDPAEWMEAEVYGDEPVRVAA